jgi:3-hydroxybutyryl-CoA dehydrogenase
MEIKRVGVIGCGLMGSGIVEVCARAGYEVRVMEVNQELLDRGIGRIQGSIDRAVERNRVTPADRDAAIGRITGTTDLTNFRDVDYVIEAVREDLEEKKAIFKTLSEVTPAHAVLSTNTSSLSVADLAAMTNRPQQVLGMHFFNPAPVLPLLEMVRTFVTSDEVVETSKAFGESLGKTVIVAKDTPGFIVNALLLPFLMDAIRMLESGTATKEDIDAGVKLGLAHPMGPLTLLDFIGLDTALFIVDAVFEETKDAKWAAPVLLRRMVTMGYQGRKSGRGFYEYGSV